MKKLFSLTGVFIGIYLVYIFVIYSSSLIFPMNIGNLYDCAVEKNISSEDLIDIAQEYNLTVFTTEYNNTSFLQKDVVFNYLNISDNDDIEMGYQNTLFSTNKILYKEDLESGLKLQRFWTIENEDSNFAGFIDGLKNYGIHNEIFESHRMNFSVIFSQKNVEFFLCVILLLVFCVSVYYMLRSKEIAILKLNGRKDLSISTNIIKIAAIRILMGYTLISIIFGVYLFSRYQKEPFLNYILVALLGTSLSPVVSQISFFNSEYSVLSIILGILVGIAVGFVLPPIASHSIKSHNGYNLYNIGFASGLLATLLMSIMRGFGINLDSRLIWHSGSNKILFILLLICCMFLITIGIMKGNNNKINFKNINRQTGRLISDFYILFKESTYINMGILGILSTCYVILIGGDLNGATICGIFTIIGFGCFGKNIKNTIPIIIGATIAAIFNVNEVTSPSLLLSILFSTTLAPICGKFGWKYGILAGIIHVNIVANIGYLHGGLNLYNNGLAGGFVAMILIPLITTFKKEI